jgi:Fe-S-cluster containining protein
MTGSANSLPVIESCEGCGACCRVVTSPPFRRVFDGDGEEAWERLRWDRPDLLAEILADARARKANGDASFGTPCLWFDAANARCRHYELRPRACMEFALGGLDCHGARRRAGIEVRDSPGAEGG